MPTFAVKYAVFWRSPSNRWTVVAFQLSPTTILYEISHLLPRISVHGDVIVSGVFSVSIRMYKELEGVVVLGSVAVIYCNYLSKSSANEARNPAAAAFCQG